MSDANPAKFKKLVTLLGELFQLDQPDLDFGIYRIMHAKAGEVTRFLEQDLLPQVKGAFASYQPADKAALQTELAKALEQAQALGADPETLPKVKELRARVANESVDISALENEVYDHLYTFFRRHYAEGDFLTKRVYKPGVYAIPYEGEEVILHWANKDQYYIKTGESLREYAFCLIADAKEGKDLKRVRFKLVDVTQGTHGNLKVAEGKERVFILADVALISLQVQELEICFEYRPATLDDWPEARRLEELANAEKDKKYKLKIPSQKDLRHYAEERIIETAIDKAPQWVADLEAQSPTQADPNRSVLGKHLKKYSDINKFDYFIHKDLGGFLRQELDFYIKNEVMHLDDVEGESALKVEQYLSKVKVIRGIAKKFIAFLAQLEDFQKKLWLKKKFVFESRYCIAIGQVPEEFFPEIAGSSSQREEWVEMLGIDTIKGDALSPGYSAPLTPAFLKAHPTLLVDTAHFAREFVARLLEALDDLDERVDVVMVHGDNFQGLSTIQAKYHGKIKSAYLDPPYNTGSDGFPYKDSYQHSSWMSMMSDRLRLVRDSLHNTGSAFVSIDENEVRQLHGLLVDIFGAQNFLTDIVWQGSSKNDQRYFSISHEYMLAVLRDKDYLDKSGIRWLERKEGLDDIYAAFRQIKSDHASDFEAQSAALKQWYSDLKPSHPAKAQSHFNRVEKRGIYFPDNISKPAKGYYYDVLHPSTGKKCAKPKGGWRFIESTMKDELKQENIHFGEDETTIPCRKSFLHETEFMSPRTVIYQDGRAATGVIRDLFGSKEVFANPKDHKVLAKLLRLVVADGEVVLDPFAGSGSTGQAVISLNREDGARRKLILMEMGAYFDTVLLPRIKKVTFTPEWKEGKPKRMPNSDEIQRSPRVIKVIRQESYEDTIGNLVLARTAQQRLLLEGESSKGADGLREQYLLRYQLSVEAKGSTSLLDMGKLADPDAYTLKIKSPLGDESREVNVDLLETFNWLLGLTVQHIAAPRSFFAEFERDGQGRLQIKGRLKQDASYPWWFRTVIGATPEGRKTLVIWRKLTGNTEQDNLVLDTWFKDKQAYSVRDTEFDLIYVNGDNTLENLKTADDTWKVRLIEEDFHRLMFEGTES